MNNSLPLTTTIPKATATAKELRHLKNSELDLHIKSLAQHERELLTQVLQVIKEIDNRRLYLELGYGSLFAYLTESVGYSAASAQRRIDAARLLNEIPVLSEKIENGEIHLTQASMIQKAAREIKRTRQMSVSTEDKLDLLSSLSGKNQRETEIQVAQYFDMPTVQKSVERAQADESVRLEITLSKSQYEKLKQAQALVSHAVPSNQIADFIEYVSSRVIKQKTSVKKDLNVNAKNNLSKTSFAELSAIPSAVKVATEETAPSSAIATDSAAELDTSNIKKNTQTTKGFPLRIKKQILSRQLSCQYHDPTSDKLCGSTWFLQVDHKHSRWAGGNSELKNATVLCSRHNHFKYRNETQIKLK